MYIIQQHEWRNNKLKFICQNWNWVYWACLCCMLTEDATQWNLQGIFWLTSGTCSMIWQTNWMLCLSEHPSQNSLGCDIQVGESLKKVGSKVYEANNIYGFYLLSLYFDWIFKYKSTKHEYSLIGQVDWDEGL